MFKIETVVQWLVVTALAAGALAVAADDEDRPNSNNRTNISLNQSSDKSAIAGKIWDTLVKEKCMGDKKGGKCKPIWDEYYNAMGDSAYSCQDIEAKYDEALSKFDSACSNLGMKKSGPGSAYLGCSFAMEQCAVCPYSSEGDDDYGRYHCGGIEVSEDTGEMSDGNSTVGKYCPGKLSKNDKDLTDEIKESRERVKELQEKVDEKEKENKTTESDANDKLLELRKQQVERQKNFEEQMSGAEDKKTEALNQVKQQISQLEAQYAQVGVDIKNLELSKNDIDDLYKQTVTSLEISCNDQATAAVTTMMNQAIADYRSNRRNLGTFNDMLSRQKDYNYWQGEADKIYQACLRSMRITEGKKKASEAKSTALTKVDAGIFLKSKEQDRIAEQMDQLKSKSGCNMTGTVEEADQPATCQAYIRYQRDAERLARNYQMDQQMAAQEAQQVQSKAMMEALTKQQKGSSDEEDLKVEKARLADLERLRRLSEAQGGGNSDGRTAWETTDEAYGTLKNLAARYSSPNCSSICEGKCARAKKFSDAVSGGSGADLDVNIGKSGNEPSTTHGGTNTDTVRAGTGSDTAD